VYVVFQSNVIQLEQGRKASIASLDLNAWKCIKLSAYFTTTEC